MSIDDLKQEWGAGAGGLGLKLDAASLRASAVQRVRGSLRWLTGLTVFELLANVLGLIVLARFAALHREARFAIPDACLALVVAANLASNVRQIARVHGVDFGGPIASVQTRLASIALERVRVTLGTFLVSPLLWTPLMIVGLCWLGVDAYELLGWNYLGANLLLGAALIPAAIWLSRRYAKAIHASPKAQWLMDQIAGYSLSRAKAALAELQQSET